MHDSEPSSSRFIVVYSLMISGYKITRAVEKRLRSTVHVRHLCPGCYRCSCWCLRNSKTSEAIKPEDVEPFPAVPTKPELSTSDSIEDLFASREVVQNASGITTAKIVDRQRTCENFAAGTPTVAAVSGASVRTQAEPNEWTRLHNTNEFRPWIQSYFHHGMIDDFQRLQGYPE